MTVINPRGRVHIIGMRQQVLSDLYYFLINRSWGFLFAAVVAGFLLINSLYACLYLLDRDGVANLAPGSFTDAFFFSVQTVATIGYGYMYPKSLIANLLVTSEGLCGVVGFALITGLAFAKFSKPRARVIFSENMVVTKHNGKLTLMFRVANERANYIADATVQVTMLKRITTAEGRSFNQMIDIPLTRNRSVMFILSWTVMHEIDHASPLYGISASEWLKQGSSLICTISGYDSSIGQNIHARHQYGAENLLWNQRLRDILRPAPDGNGVTVDHHLFHATEDDGDTDAPSPH